MTEKRKRKAKRVYFVKSEEEKEKNVQKKDSELLLNFNFFFPVFFFFPGVGLDNSQSCVTYSDLVCVYLRGAIFGSIRIIPPPQFTFSLFLFSLFFSSLPQNHGS